MPFPRVTDMARQIIADSISTGAHVVDASVGNGRDTLFLAELVGPTGRVDGFDVQAKALANTRRLIGEAPQVVLHHTGHENIAHCVCAPVQAAMFNLGYLPNGDHFITTRPETTLAALDAVLSLLSDSGLITLVAYPGHTGGREEAEAVETWFKREATRHLRVIRYAPAYTRTPAPYLIAAEKLSV